MKVTIREKANSSLIMDDVTADLKSKEIQKIFRTISYTDAN